MLQAGDGLVPADPEDDCCADSRERRAGPIELGIVHWKDRSGFTDEEAAIGFLLW